MLFSHFPLFWRASPSLFQSCPALSKRFCPQRDSSEDTLLKVGKTIKANNLCMSGRRTTNRLRTGEQGSLRRAWFTFETAFRKEAENLGNLDGD